METSICEDEGQFAGVVEDAIRGSSEDGFSFNSAIALKKNLTETFNQQMSQVDHVARYEDSNSVTAPSALLVPNTSSSLVDCSQQTSRRPPLATAYGYGKDESFYSKKLAVFLRIRPLPPPSSKPNDNDGHKQSNPDVNVSTIEVLESVGCRATTTIRTYPPSISNAYKVNINRQGRDPSAYAKEFSFDRVMGPETSQKTVYSMVAAPMIQAVLQAVLKPDVSRVPFRPSTSDISRQSALLFSYGITNAGKTHTVLGDVNSANQASWGLIPRAIADVFDRIRIVASMSTNQQYPPCELFVSFFEIYNEQVYDLMPDSAIKPSSAQNTVFGPPEALKVRECRGQILVRGLARHRVKNVEHGVTLTKMAHNKRHTSSNNLNSDSSRSHFICQMHLAPQQYFGAGGLASQGHVTSANNDDDSCAVSMSGYSTDEEAIVKAAQVSGTIWIVDLAGSERSKRTGVGSARQKESTQINKSLMILMRCLNSIKDHSKQWATSSSVIPFRESKLTHIFMNHLGSKSAARTAMVVNVNPSVEDFDETQHVLAYASKARLIEMKPEDYNGKRKQYAEHDYGLDGRKKKQKIQSQQDPSIKESKKPSIFARMAKNLSPKRVLQKRTAGSKKLAQETKLVMAGPVSYKAPTTDTDEPLNGSGDIEILRKALSVSEAEANSLRYENARLVEEMRNKEHQIRTEVSVEMEERLRETRVKHQEKLELLRSQIQRETSKTEFTVSMNKAEDQLEELLDRVDESEKEMVRMTLEHKREVDSLHAKIEKLQDELKLEATQRKDTTERVRYLENQLETSHATIRCLQETLGGAAVVDSTSENSNRLKGTDVLVGGELPASNTTKKSLAEKPTALSRRLRPRKALHNSTNQRAA
jgi:hypothetical protein